MDKKTEQAIRVKSIALDIIEDLLKEDSEYDGKSLKQSSELLARCICDLVNVYTGVTEDVESTLKGTIIKAKVSHNSLQNQQAKINN